VDPIVNNPLGNYVFATWVAMAFAAGGAGWGLSNLSKCNDEQKGQLALFCLADIALAFLHSGMAYYMQRAIVSGLGGKDYRQMTAKEIQEQAGQVLLYDVPCCLYFFAANAAFGFNCWGLSLDASSCGSLQPQMGAAFMMISWGMCAGGYLFCWYCCKCCQGALPSKPGGGQKPVVVGTPTHVSRHSSSQRLHAVQHFTPVCLLSTVVFCRRL